MSSQVNYKSLKDNGINSTPKSCVLTKHYSRRRRNSYHSTLTENFSITLVKKNFTGLPFTKKNCCDVGRGMIERPYVLFGVPFLKIGNIYMTYKVSIFLLKVDGNKVEFPGQCPKIISPEIRNYSKLCLRRAPNKGRLGLQLLLLPSWNF